MLSTNHVLVINIFALFMVNISADIVLPSRHKVARKDPILPEALLTRGDTETSVNSEKLYEMSEAEFEAFIEKHKKFDEKQEKKRKKEEYKEFVKSNLHAQLRDRHGHWVVAFAVVTFVSLLIVLYSIAGVREAEMNLPDITDEDNELLAEYGKDCSIKNNSKNISVKTKQKLQKDKSKQKKID